MMRDFRLIRYLQTARNAALTFCCVLGFALPGAGATVEPVPELHQVMGGLYALSAALELQQSEAKSGALPNASSVTHYFKDTASPAGTSVQLKSADGSWWVGVPVPNSPEARRFLRLNAPALKVFEDDTRTAWLGGKYAWMRAARIESAKNKSSVVFASFEAREGYEKDRDWLFFSSSGTDNKDWVWQSPFLFTESAHNAVLKQHGRNGSASDPSLTAVQAAPKAKETFKASPVGLPPQMTLSKDEEEDYNPGGGDVAPEN